MAGLVFTVGPLRISTTLHVRGGFEFVWRLSMGHGHKRLLAKRLEKRVPLREVLQRQLRQLQEVSRRRRSRGQ
jgi:hypothetical protein